MNAPGKSLPANAGNDRCRQWVHRHRDALGAFLAELIDRRLKTFRALSAVLAVLSFSESFIPPRHDGLMYFP